MFGDLAWAAATESPTAPGHTRSSVPKRCPWASSDSDGGRALCGIVFGDAAGVKRVSGRPGGLPAQAPHRPRVS
jgi:hypothetical protein